MAIQLYSDIESSLEVYQKIIIFGGPASGKTTLALSLAEEYNILYFVFENNFARAIASFPLAWKKRIAMIRIPDTKTDHAACDTMYKISQGLSGEICVEHGKLGCLACIRAGKKTNTWNPKLINRKNTICVFDSATQLTTSVISRASSGKDETYKLDFDDWAAVGNILSAIFSWTQAIDLHTIWISHESAIKMEDDKEKLVPTAGSVNFSRNFARYFSHVLYCDKVLNLNAAPGSPAPAVKHIVASSSTYKTNIITASNSGLALEKEAKPSLFSIFGHLPKESIDDHFSFLPSDSGSIVPTSSNGSNVVGSAGAVSVSGQTEVPNVKTALNLLLAKSKANSANGAKS